MSRDPAKLRYAKTHEWVDLDASGGEPLATIGISRFAVEALTDLVFIDLPAVGRRLTAGEPFGEIESVKAVSDLYSPVSGEVVEANARLADRLETLGSDPYGSGWMIRVRIDDPRQVEALMTHEQYEKQCAEEQH